MLASPDVSPPPGLAEFEAAVTAEDGPAIVMIDRGLARHLVRYLRDVEGRLASAEDGYFW